jgi:SAM-dependent methyltransferase
MKSCEEPYKCVICQRANLQELANQPEDYEYFVKSSRKFKTWHCRDCGSRVVYPHSTLEELISFYPLDYHAYSSDHGEIAQILVDVRARMRAGQMIKLADNLPVRLFDVGAGDCRHFIDMSKHGNFEFAGVEIKPEMVEAARANGFHVEQGTLEGLDISSLKGKFDIVTMYQLVEHVLDPQLLLEKAKALLKPGGYVLGQLPSMDSFERKVFGCYWAGYHFPRHLQMLEKSGMSLILKRAGFEDVRVTGALHLQAALSFQNMIAGKLKRRPKMIFGKTPFYSGLLLAAIPFCAFEYICGQPGMMNFSARVR